MDGGTDVDNNAVLFAKGYNSVLDPLYADGTYKKLSEAVVKGWKVANAAPAFTQALTAAGGKVDGVVAANDDIANAVITVLQSKGLKNVPVTGQDAGIEGLQHILKGEQCMTVFKDVSKEADAAAKLAIALIKGTGPDRGRAHADRLPGPEGQPHPQGAAAPADCDHQGQRAGRHHRRRPHCRPRSARASSPSAPRLASSKSERSTQFRDGRPDDLSSGRPVGKAGATDTRRDARRAMLTRRPEPSTSQKGRPWPSRFSRSSA